MRRLCDQPTSRAGWVKSGRGLFSPKGRAGKACRQGARLDPSQRMENVSGDKELEATGGSVKADEEVWSCRGRGCSGHGRPPVGRGVTGLLKDRSRTRTLI